MKKQLLSLITSLCLFGGIAQASEQPYNAQALQQALAAKQPVALDFYADWCSTCHEQRPILDRIARRTDMQNVTLFIVDFDNEKDLEKTLVVHNQSTVIAFKDGKEAGRSVGQTKEAPLLGLMRKAISPVQ